MLPQQKQTQTPFASFHTESMQHASSQFAGAHWVTTTKPMRVVDYKLFVHYHPYVDQLIDKLNTGGLPSMLDIKYLETLKADLFKPNLPANVDQVPYLTGGNIVQNPYPKEEIDVSDQGPYSIYNWELFFHSPLAVAVHLSRNQRFAESQKWFHYIFDPTNTDTSVPAPQRYWKFIRFRHETSTTFIKEMLESLSNPADTPLKQSVLQSIENWRNKPFQPHVIARGRYLAYQINVLMKYLDNLLAWGDNLFRQDTIETLNEATQLYVLAASILGRKPQQGPARQKTTPRTYAQLKDAGIDAFGNAMIEMENDFPFNTVHTSHTSGEKGSGAVLGLARSLYFCIPQNDQLLAYWDKVADRLFKIRHCMNIDGVVRKLPLFEPPIDPGMLVKAVAAGLDIASIVNNINQPLSNIRGPMLLQKAMEICNEVKSLGGALLSALEKGDSEHISMLRQQQEISILNLVREVKYLQWKEAEAATEGLLRSRNTAFERWRHYKLILGNQASGLDQLKTVSLQRPELTEETFDSVYDEWVNTYAVDITKEAYREETSVGGIMEFAGNIVTSIAQNQLGKTLPLNKNENAELNVFLPSSDTFNTISFALRAASAGLALVPQFNAHGTPVGVGAAVGFGGVELSKFAKTGSEVAKEVANAFVTSAERASKMGGYYRRAEEYVLQANLAGSELMQYGRQVISSLIREKVAKHEYDNHLKQIENAETLEAFLQDKFTNEELYAWMQGEISKTYFECYKFAYDIAKRAEQTMKHELMRKEFDDLNLIKFGYWDSARKGLLAGESLYFDLKRLEMAYHEQNTREYEMTKHISIRRLDPMALLKLKATGSCEISIPEWVYDLDSPGQYMRRIKSVAVTIPCVAGPYTGVHSTLSLLNSSVRISSVSAGDYPRANAEDIRFRDFRGAIQSIVTSTGQNDSGMFETNLRDERYLPFEGAGAISDWRITLPNNLPQFDFESISDIVLHVRYTAREAGHLAKAASDSINDNVFEMQDNLFQLFSINSDFASPWYNFTTAANDGVRKLDLKVTKDQFPYCFRQKALGTLKATFCTIDLAKKKLVLATDSPSFTGDDTNGWTLSINNASTVFPFLKKNNMKNKIYMMISYVTV